MKMATTKKGLKLGEQNGYLHVHLYVRPFNCFRSHPGHLKYAHSDIAAIKRENDNIMCGNLSLVFSFDAKLVFAGSSSIEGATTTGRGALLSSLLPPPSQTFWLHNRLLAPKMS